MKREYNLTLKDKIEAEIATEFGDGTIFNEGDIVIHNPKSGTFKKGESSWEK